MTHEPGLEGTKTDIAQSRKTIINKQVKSGKALCVRKVLRHILVLGMVEMEDQLVEGNKNQVMKDPAAYSRTLKI